MASSYKIVLDNLVKNKRLPVDHAFVLISETKYYDGVMKCFLKSVPITTHLRTDDTLLERVFIFEENK